MTIEDLRREYPYHKMHVMDYDTSQSVEIIKRDPLDVVSYSVDNYNCMVVVYVKYREHK